MGLFDRLGGQRSGPQQMNQQQMQQIDPQTMQQMQQDVDRIKSGPAEYLKQYGKTIPDGMTDAKQITQYLLQTGQIGIPRLNQVMKMLGR